MGEVIVMVGIIMTIILGVGGVKTCERKQKQEDARICFEQTKDKTCWERFLGEPK